MTGKVVEFDGTRTFVGATQKARGSDEFEAVKSAVYLYGLRCELSGRDREHDELVHGGSDAQRAYIIDSLGDEPEPIHSHWGRVIDALLTLEKSIKSGMQPTGGLLDLIDHEPTVSETV